MRLRWTLAVGLILVLVGLPAAAKWLALAAIDDYQAKISPFKGYRCAYAMLHGGMTCSAYGKQVIREQGLWQGVRFLRRRFRECHEAAKILSDLNAPRPPAAAPAPAP